VRRPLDLVPVADESASRQGYLQASSASGDIGVGLPLSFLRTLRALSRATAFFQPIRERVRHAPTGVSVDQSGDRVERLAAFEFIAATDDPQQVVVKNKGVPVLQIGFRSWVGLNLQCDVPVLEFENRQDLTIEGIGLGRPYWAGDPLPSWASAFDGPAELRRINAIRTAARAELNAAALSVN
jgi:hypothetical protein